MDILSLSKATRAIRDIKDLDENVVAKQAEDRFLTVDHRLDWIEAQADKVLVENSLKIDLSKGVFHNTKLIDGKLKLAKNNSSYFPSGYWESLIIDLGVGWKETNIVNVIKETFPQTDISIKVSTSNDGVSFTEYSLLDEENPPQARYLKIKAILTAEADVPGEDHSYIFDQLEDEVRVVLNDFTEADGQLKLKTDYEYVMSKDDAWLKEGSVHRKLIKSSDWKKINSINVEEVN